jgi:FMN phosphatase YigB (HAD superfamily)
MTADFILYVDFDSTLYDTGTFIEELWKLIASKASLPVDTVREDSKSHYFHPYLGGYEYEEHFSRYGLNAPEMWRALDTITDNADFLYPDSAKFIQKLRARGYDPKILTFGEKRFQLAKINPMIKYLVSEKYPDPLEVIVVDKKKNEHIAALHEGQTGRPGR